MRLNPLTILGLNATLPLMLALFPSSTRMLFTVIFAFGILVYLKQLRIAVQVMFFFSIFIALYTLSLYYLPIPVIIMLFRMTYLICPCILMAIALLRSYHSAEIFAALERLRLPKTFVIALSLTLRYIPTFGREFKIIREAMATRGVQISIAHPLRTIEYLIVPQLFRCLALSTELTAASLCRGIRSESRRARYFDLPFSYRDGIVVLIFMLGMTLL